MHAGNVDRNQFRNTCFIASVLQLHDFSPELVDTLKLTELGWSSVVSYVRSEACVNGQDKLDARYDGLHDAAESLGHGLWVTTFPT